MFKLQICLSQPHVEIPDDYYKPVTTSVKHKKIGEILQEAGLVSATQVEIALQDQQLYPELHLGEILALRGWVQQKTADFFAEKWEDKIYDPEKAPIGKYLQEAGLLEKEQIELILQEQKLTFLKFGAIVVLKGWIKQNTLNFFVHNLFPEDESDSIYVGPSNSRAKSIQAERQTQVTNDVRIIQPQYQSQVSHGTSHLGKKMTEIAMLRLW